MSGQENTVPNNEEKKEMVPVNQVFSNFPSQAEWNTINQIATVLKQGGVLPKSIDTLPKLVVALQAGRELGLQPIEAMNSLYFVNGKVAMYGEAVPLQIMRAGHNIEWGECNKETATVTITRGDNGNSMTQTFTMAEAQERGYTSNPIYKKYPENMLKWRVLGMVAKFICPDALKGIGIKEDMQAEVVDKGGKFHNAEEAKVVEEEVESGELGNRPTLDDVLNAKEEPKVIQGNEPDGFPCEECDRIMQTKAGLTKHMKTHAESETETEEVPEGNEDN